MRIFLTFPGSFCRWETLCSNHWIVAETQHISTKQLEKALREQKPILTPFLKRKKKRQKSELWIFHHQTIKPSLLQTKSLNSALLHVFQLQTDKSGPQKPLLWHCIKLMQHMPWNPVACVWTAVFGRAALFAPLHTLFWLCCISSDSMPITLLIPVH